MRSTGAFVFLAANPAAVVSSQVRVDPNSSAGHQLAQKFKQASPLFTATVDQAKGLWATRSIPLTYLWENTFGDLKLRRGGQRQSAVFPYSSRDGSDPVLAEGKRIIVRGDRGVLTSVEATEEDFKAAQPAGTPTQPPTTNLPATMPPTAFLTPEEVMALTTGFSSEDALFPAFSAAETRCRLSEGPPAVVSILCRERLGRLPKGHCYGHWAGRIM